jgi:hypothetical protein
MGTPAAAALVGLIDLYDPSLRLGVEIWRPWRQRHPRDPSIIDDLLKGRAVFPVAWKISVVFVSWISTLKRGMLIPLSGSYRDFHFL